MPSRPVNQNTDDPKLAKKLAKEQAKQEKAELKATAKAAKEAAKKMGKLSKEELLAERQNFIDKNEQLTAENMELQQKVEDLENAIRRAKKALSIWFAPEL